MFLTTPAGCRGGAAAAAALGGSRLVTAFASGGAQEAAESLWQQLGRAGERRSVLQFAHTAVGCVEAVWFPQPAVQLASPHRFNTPVPT